MAEPSLAQQSFLENRKRRLRAITFARIFIFLLFLIIWEASARLHLIDAFIFSSPSRVYRMFVSMISDHSIFLHIVAKIIEIILIIIGTIFAIPINKNIIETSTNKKFACLFK